MAICAVFWCIDQARPKRMLCKQHAERPVLHDSEDSDAYRDRLFAEDASKRSTERRKHAKSEPKQVSFDDEALIP